MLFSVEWWNNDELFKEQKYKNKSLELIVEHSSDKYVVLTGDSIK